MVILDVNAPKEEIKKVETADICEEPLFKMEVDEASDETSRVHPIGHTLDVCMDKLFNYVIMECHNTDSGEVDWDKTKRKIFAINIDNVANVIDH